jgi:phospholipid transport system substrate-binding protein
MVQGGRRVEMGRVRGRSRRAVAALIALLTIGGIAAAAVAEESASAVAAGFNDALLASMKHADALGYQGRYKQLRPAVEGSFDLPFMAEKVLGRRWGELSQADRARWQETFTELLAATYAGRFVGYRGQTFETRGEEAAARDTVLVLTRLVDPKGDNVDINYRLRRVDDRWQIVDVYLKGTVSELALRRSEYSSVLEREGFSALIEAVRAKIAALERGEDK